MRTKNDLLLDPTLRDLFVQHFGMNREMSPEPVIKATKRWDAWLSVVGTMDDDALLSSRLLAIRFETLLLEIGKHAEWRQQNAGFECRDLYYTPARAEDDIRKELRGRRTEGTLRDLVVAQVVRLHRFTMDSESSEKGAALKQRLVADREAAFAMASDPTSSMTPEERRNTLLLRLGQPDDPDPTPSTDPSEIDALSDWDLSDAWSKAAWAAAHYSLILPLPDDLDHPLLSLKGHARG